MKIDHLFLIEERDIRSLQQCIALAAKVRIKNLPGFLLKHNLLQKLFYILILFGKMTFLGQPKINISWQKIMFFSFPPNRVKFEKIFDIDRGFNVEYWFKKNFNLLIHQHKAFFFCQRFLSLLHKSLLCPILWIGQILNTNGLCQTW